MGLLEIRSSKNILREVETYAEARATLGALEARRLGGICLRGVASPNHPVRHQRELWRFMQEAADATSGHRVTATTLQIRCKPPVRPNQPDAGLSPFTKDTPMHFDGFYEVEFDSVTGERTLHTWHELLNRATYPGVSSHIM